MVAPIVAAVISPFLQELFSNGLSLIGNAILSKGQDVVEKELGVKIETTPPETLLRLQQEKEEFLLKAAMTQAEFNLKAEQQAQENVSTRWKADMLSDSKLSKNIRPGVLIYLLTIFTIFAIGSEYGIDIKKEYIDLLGQMLIMVMSAYFVGRTVEKVIDMREKGKYNVATN